MAWYRLELGGKSTNPKTRYDGSVVSALWGNCDKHVPYFKNSEIHNLFTRDVLHSIQIFTITEHLTIIWGSYTRPYITTIQGRLEVRSLPLNNCEVPARIRKSPHPNEHKGRRRPSAILAYGIMPIAIRAYGIMVHSSLSLPQCRAPWIIVMYGPV